MPRVIILMGLPGSGKSTWAKGQVADVCSADAYFDGPPGRRFEPRLLPEAHGECMRKFIDLCRHQNKPTLIVDNTNTTLVELAPYLAVAAAYRHFVEIRHFVCSVMEANDRTMHDVPAEVLVRMERNLKETVTTMPPWWPRLLTHVTGDPSASAAEAIFTRAKLVTDAFNVELAADMDASRRRRLGVTS